MNDIQTIQSKIYVIRGQRVMLDFDLAAMYGVETRALNQAVKRNSKRFEGDDFMFRLTKDEATQVSLRSQIVTLDNLNETGSVEYSTRSRSQIVTLNTGRGSNFKYLPYAFTELGVAMLSSVLKSETAIKVNRNIKRFPPDFMFQLTKEEFAFLKQSLIFQNGITNEELKKAKGILRTGRGGVRQFEVTRDELSRCQIGTMNIKQGHNIKYLPFAFFLHFFLADINIMCIFAAEK